MHSSKGQRSLLQDFLLPTPEKNPDPPLHLVYHLSMKVNWWGTTVIRKYHIFVKWGITLQDAALQA